MADRLISRIKVALRIFLWGITLPLCGITFISEWNAKLWEGVTE